MALRQTGCNGGLMRCRRLICCLVRATMVASSYIRGNQVMAIEVLSPITSATPAHDNAPLVESYLLNGKLSEGETALLAELKADPGNDQVRFGLGVLQF